MALMLCRHQWILPRWPLYLDGLIYSEKHKLCIILHGLVTWGVAGPEFLKHISGWIGYLVEGRVSRSFHDLEAIRKLCLYLA